MTNRCSTHRTFKSVAMTAAGFLLFLWMVSLSTRLPVYASDHEIQGTIWVANETGNSLTVIDAGTNEVITTLTGIEGPHNLQVSPDGKTVWAVSGHDSTALVIDAATYTLLGTIPTGEHPAHVILAPDGQTAYVTNAGDNTITVMDVATLTVTATIPVGKYPHGLRPSPDGRWIYVANLNGTTLSVIDTTTNTTVAAVEVGQQPVQVAFSPDGQFVYASLNAENAVAKVDVAARQLIDTVAVGTGPVQVFVTPDNKDLLVANQGTEVQPGTSVSIVDTATFEVVSTIETGKGAHGVVIEPTGQFAYITNIYGNSVAVLDLTTRKIVETVPTGPGPNGISFSPVPASLAVASEIALTLNGSNAEPATTTDDHEAHHPETETTPTPAPDTGTGTDMNMGQMGDADSASMMQQIGDMMNTMMGMDMSDEMRSQMEQMQGMMDMMKMMPGMDMSSSMQQMGDMMNTMMGMDMSDEMRSQMEQMQGMMSGTTTPDAMGGMDMGGGHAMEAINSEGVSAATETIGGQPLEFQLEDGVKVFEITAERVIWNILDDIQVTAWTYNGTVPGPMIRVTEGDRVRINFTNRLPEPTTIHWHGITVPNSMDGIAGVTQAAVQPGETFTYEFVARPAGTFMYHSHFDSDVQVGIGLYAPFIIDPAKSQEPAPDVDVSLMLSEWRVVNGQTYPAMPMSGSEPNYFTINGKAFPATETITVQRGQRVRLRLMGIGQFIHPMHLHGMPFQVVAIDGYPVPEAARQTRDTLSVAPGERYDIEFVATEPGTWVFHCHILHHVTNDGLEPGGLTLVVNISE